MNSVMSETPAPDAGQPSLIRHILPVAVGAAVALLLTVVTDNSLNAHGVLPSPEHAVFAVGPLLLVAAYRGLFTVVGSHMAARLATIQADGDAAAGVAYLQLAMDRHATDRRSLMALDAETRRSGDLSRFAQVHQIAMELAVDPMEKATHGVRAAEAMAALAWSRRSWAALYSSAMALILEPLASIWSWIC